MKKQRIIVITAFLAIVLIFIPLYSSATTLTLNIIADKEKAKIGEEIKVKVFWNEGMQAADFSLNYDSKKLQYIKSDIDDVFVNNDENEGVLNTSWVSLDDTDKNEIEYTFKVKKEGKTKFTTTVNGGFSTGQLEIPNNYNEGGLTVKIVGYHNTVLCVMVAGVLIIAIILLFSSKGRRKNKTKK